MKIGVPREIHAGERRVATTPDVAAQLIEMGFSVAVESNAGTEASFSDSAYEAAGCELISNAQDLWAAGDLILKVRAPEGEEPGMLRADQTLISFVGPGQNPELLKELTVHRVDEVDPANRRFRPMHMTMENKQNGRSSIMLFSKLQLRKDVPDDYFTARYLERQ